MMVIHFFFEYMNQSFTAKVAKVYMMFLNYPKGCTSIKVKNLTVAHY